MFVTHFFDEFFVFSIESLKELFLSDNVRMPNILMNGDCLLKIICFLGLIFCSNSVLIDLPLLILIS